MRELPIEKPPAAKQGEIVVTRANPSRGDGCEIAHFVHESGQLRSHSTSDEFLPDFARAAEWVRRRYPGARLYHMRVTSDGHLAGISFRVSATRLIRGC